MLTFIAVFGSHDILSDRYQPINAATMLEAAQYMEQVHGTKFYRIYTTDEFIQERKVGRYDNTRPLNWIGEGF